MGQPITGTRPGLRRLDISTFEMIFLIALVSLHDLLLSDALSIPIALKNSSLLHFRAWDRILSSLEYFVPVLIFAVMLVLWLMGRNAWVRTAAIIYLAWVTLRLVAKIALVLSLIIARKNVVLNVMLKDTIVLWLVIILLFGIWYWILDRGGPHARREGSGLRPDFGFPQYLVTIPGWHEWRPGFWDYVFLGFSGSTQFGLGDVSPLSVRAKLLVILHVMLSILVIVFIASIAIGAVH
jgi:hypothetical protein